MPWRGATVEIFQHSPAASRSTLRVPVTAADKGVRLPADLPLMRMVLFRWDAGDRDAGFEFTQ
jgi:hypothetical protein